MTSPLPGKHESGFCQIGSEPAAASPLPTDEDREALDYAIRVPLSEARVDYKPFWKLVKAIQDSVFAAGFSRSVVSTPEPPFSVGDRVYCLDPVNEGWKPDYTATVLAVHGDRIEIRWDHGPHNSGHLASDFGLRSAVSAPPTITDEAVQAFISVAAKEGFVLTRRVVRDGLRAALGGEA